MLRGVGLFGWAGIVVVGKMLRSYFINVGITFVLRLDLLLMSHSLLVHRQHALSCPCIMLRIGPIAPLFRTPSITVGFGLCHAAGWRLRRTRLTVTRHDARRETTRYRTSKYLWLLGLEVEAGWIGCCRSWWIVAASWAGTDLHHEVSREAVVATHIIYL